MESPNLDLAVARGAAHFGRVRQGLAKRIGGGAARSYYVEVDQQGEPKALTLLERGSQEGRSFRSDRLFHLLPNVPVSFKLLTSHTRRSDRAGDLLLIDPLEMQPLPELHTVLHFGKTKEKLPARLEARLTEIGILELALQSVHTEHRWILEFQLRGALDSKTVSRSDETFDAEELRPALEFIERFFCEPKREEKLMESLETILQREKKLWPASVLRALADTVLKQAAKRHTSPKLEERFWNCLGFFLRPGFGFPLDDFRLKEVWKLILEDLSKKNLDLQKWICYRRIAGGLSKGQQTRLAQELLESKVPRKFKTKEESYLYSEKVRTLASLEWLDVTQKIALGNAALARILAGEATSADYFAVGRLGARKLLYAAFTQVISQRNGRSVARKTFVI